MKPLIDQLLQAPPDQMDEYVKESIQKWSNPPTIQEVDNTINEAIVGSGASDFVMTVFSIIKDNIHYNSQ